MRSALSLLLVSLVPLACTGSADPSPPDIGSSSDDGGAFGQGVAPPDIPVADNEGASPTPPEADDAADASTSNLGESADERAAAPSEETAAPVSTHPLDAGPDGACTKPLRPGDLSIHELMIESVSGAEDEGQC